MSNQMLYYIMGASVGILILIIIAYFILSKKMNKSEYKRIQRLQQGTKEKKFSTEVLYQKLYVTYIKIPFIKRYILKLRRRLEIINIDDEYNTRKDAAKILTRTLIILFPLVLLTIIITHTNYLLMFILLIFELFMIDVLVDGSVDKIDNKILKEQGLEMVINNETEEIDKTQLTVKSQVPQTGIKIYKGNKVYIDY